MLKGEQGPARQTQMIVTVAFNHRHCLQLDVPWFQNRVSTGLAPSTLTRA